MPTDTERREVARRLLVIKDTRNGCGHDMCCDLWSAIFDSDYRCTELCDECEVAVLNSLTDLIDPGEPSGHECVPGECSLNVRHDSDFVDRDALLALADAMEEKADDWDVSQDDVPLVHAGYLTAYAERIRKALGVENAGA